MLAFKIMFLFVMSCAVVFCRIYREHQHKALGNIDEAVLCPNVLFCARNCDMRPLCQGWSYNSGEATCFLSNGDADSDSFMVMMDGEVVYLLESIERSAVTAQSTNTQLPATQTTAQSTTQPPTTIQPTTTIQPPTTIEPTTTIQPPTTTEHTTTTQPKTSNEQTSTTQSALATQQATATQTTSTTQPPTNDQQQTTRQSTTSQPTTTTQPPTTTHQPTTTQPPPNDQQQTTRQSTTSQPTTTTQPTTATTASQPTSSTQSTSTGSTNTAQPTTTIATQVTTTTQSTTTPTISAGTTTQQTTSNTPTTLPSVIVCESGWTAVGHRCVKPYSARTWSNSMLSCNNSGARLVHIYNTAEIVVLSQLSTTIQSSLSLLINLGMFWAGINDIDAEGFPVGVAGKNVTGDVMATMTLNSETADCVFGAGFSFLTKQLTFMSCTYSLPYICEKDASSF